MTIFCLSLAPPFLAPLPATPNRLKNLRRAGFPPALLVQFTRFEAFHLANLGSLVHRRFAASGRMQNFSPSSAPLSIKSVKRPFVAFYPLSSCYRSVVGSYRDSPSIEQERLPRSLPMKLAGKRPSKLPVGRAWSAKLLPTNPLLLIVWSQSNIPLLPPHPSRPFKHPLGPTLGLASVDQAHTAIHLNSVLGLPIPPSDRIAHHGERPNGEGHRLAHEPGLEVGERRAVVRWRTGAGRGSGRGAEEGAIDEDIEGVP